MRLPPDKSGYKPITRGFLETGIEGVVENPWEKYEADIRQTYGILDDESFYLRSDNVTGQEHEEWKANVTTLLPSYRIFKITDTGREVEVTTPNDRWSGVP
jgi:hypothetical protein